jgi:hypothetical protein
VTTTAAPTPAAVEVLPRRSRRLRWVVLGVVALAALVHVPFPFSGDQALFTYFASAMRHGDRLYVDLWDYKQPGIFLWYLVSGSVFGFNETGVHIAELLWSLGFAACMQRMLRDRVENPWVADVSPLLTIGAFYAVARAWDLTQVEWLVAFPIMLSLWAAADAGNEGTSRRWRLLLSGLGASAVVYFKLVYGVIPVVFWLYILSERRKRREGGRDETARDARALVLGFLAPMLPMLVYFLHEHLLGTMWWSYVTYPPKIVGSIAPPPFSRLRSGVWFFVTSFAWLGVLAGAAVLRRTPSRHTDLRETDVPRDPLAVGLLIWFVLGWVTVVIQNEWGYQFVFPLIPVGLLGAFGLDRLWSRWTARAISRGFLVAVAVVTALCAAYPAKQTAYVLKRLAQNGFALSARDHLRFETAVGGYYVHAREAAAFVRQRGRAPGAIHVEGSPLIQYLSGRRYALREHGWAAEQSDARLWRWTRDGLREARPVYLWVDDFSIDIMHERSPETLVLIDSMYCQAHRVADGEWYALHGSRECSVDR